MKKFRLLFLALILGFGSQMAFAQDSAYVNNEYAKAMALYNRAQRYNDALVSKQALMEMAILNPGDTAVLRSLAEIYFGGGQYVSSAMVAMDMVKIHPGNLFALEVAAVSYENLRLYDKAIEQYEAMWLATENATVLYQVSYLQYLLDRFAEANANLDILVTKTADENITLSKEDGTNQEVKFLAAIENLRGLIALDQKNNEKARGHFTKALELSPDFEAAQNSLAGMN
ncbi:MAG: tetratricopeptide repeat protein [Cytophagia bacterium]|nr:tetratricopeptide repeat protein [Cytophagia bacterium]